MQLQISCELSSSHSLVTVHSVITANRAISWVSGSADKSSYKTLVLSLLISVISISDFHKALLLHSHVKSHKHSVSANRELAWPAGDTSSPHLQTTHLHTAPCTRAQAPTAPKAMLKEETKRFGSNPRLAIPAHPRRPLQQDPRLTHGEHAMVLSQPGTRDSACSPIWILHTCAVRT